MHRDYDYLIVGGGMVADSAAKAIREEDDDGTIGILGEETSAPFPRPALSKKLWTDPDFDLETADPDTARVARAQLHLGTTVTGLDVEQAQVSTAEGDTYGYGELLLATGGHPVEIDDLPRSDRVLYYRTLADYRHLRAASEQKPHVAVVGGGWIGCEIAAALVQHDCAVTLIHPDQVLNEKKFPATLAATFESLFARAGVTLRAGVEVESGTEDDDGVHLRLSDGTEVLADLVVVGIGVAPSSEYAAGVLERADDGGIVVDERLATSADHVFAAGDVAQYPDRLLGRSRVEHVDNAQTMAATVAKTMTGSVQTYDHTPMYYSDVFDHGFEAIGVLDSSMTMLEDADGQGGEVVYYVDEEKVRGVLLWNCEGGLESARALLADPARPDDLESLRGRVTFG